MPHKFGLWVGHELREGTAEKHREHDGLRVRGTAPSPSVSTVGGDAVAKLGAHRVLVSPQSLKLVDPLGRMEKQDPTVLTVRLVSPRQAIGRPCASRMSFMPVTPAA